MNFAKVCIWAMCIVYTCCFGAQEAPQLLTNTTASIKHGTGHFGIVRVVSFPEPPSLLLSSLSTSVGRSEAATISQVRHRRQYGLAKQLRFPPKLGPVFVGEHRISAIRGLIGTKRVPGDYWVSYVSQQGNFIRLGVNVEEGSVTDVDFTLNSAWKWMNTEKKNSIGMSFTRIPAGSFIMGSPPTGFYDDEKPLHIVTISFAFWLGTHEVTQEQWETVMNCNPSCHKGARLPVDGVSRDDCLEFIRRLNEMEPGVGYKLPTEAEWEYACRASASGHSFRDVERMAWYRENSNGTTHPVGQREPNSWGLFDMLGNVYEWCQDYYTPYQGYDAVDPVVAKHDNNYYVVRGGAWVETADNCTPTRRASSGNDRRMSPHGVRIVRER